MSQPISFKTVPGRNRTQKWNQAKQYNYDGDEWGGFDPYDEYGGGYDEAADVPPVPAPQPHYTAEPTPGTRVNRQNSFDAGAESERRQFSGPAGYAAAAASEDRRGSPAMSSGRPSTDFERRARERNFTNPEQVPPPLATRGATGFPPRKSSFRKSPVRNAAPPVPTPDTMPAPPAPQTDKPLPFIRPSDIYKRMAEEKERERQSQESSRPSMDSIQRDAAAVDSAAIIAAENPTPSSAGPGRRPSLEPVVERGEPDALENKRLSAVQEQRASKELSSSPDAQQPAEYRPLSSLQQPEFGEPVPPAKEPSPQLPPVSRFSGFGNDFLHGSTEESYRTADGDEQTPTATKVSSQEAMGVLGSMQPSLIATRAPEGQDPAADILAERQAAQVKLQHQPSTASQGFRSVVNTAFDRKDDNSIPPTPISRDNSQSQSGSSGVSRSDTTSTAGISPIMSKVSLLATTQQMQHDRQAQVPPIAEEPSSAHTPISSRPVSGSFQIPRKPSPGHSRNVSSETAKNINVVQPGYRRSLDPPSSDNSPARTPDLVDNEDRRFSAPMAAETIAHTARATDVADEVAEPPSATLEPAKSTDEIGQLQPLASNIAIGSFAGSSDYSTREADIANSINLSHEVADYPPAAEDMRNSQQQFLRTHSASPPSPISPGRNPPASPGVLTQGLGLARAGTPNSGRDSPAKGRVREIAENYDEIHAASRRNSEATVGSSKSSWSQFGRSEENLLDASLRRKGTGLSQVETGDDRSAEEAGERDGQGKLDGPRPGLESQSSFRPHLPGEWVSFTETPADEPVPLPERGMHEPSQHQTTPRASRLAEEPVDLTPTPKKSKLPEEDALSGVSELHSDNALQQLKDAGVSLGASVLATAGLTSQSRDFGSTEPAQTVQHPEMQPKSQTGDVSSYLRPTLPHLASDARSSVASSVPPTPPAKDTPKPPVPEAGGTLDADDSNAGSNGHPVSNYFSGAIAPLRTGHSREGSRQGDALLQTERPRYSAQLSTATESGDYEIDRLRHEIVRSLDAGKEDEMQRESIVEDDERTQDALDAPENERRLEQGKPALSAAEIETQQQRDIDAEHRGKKPLLDQRFSWENPQRTITLMAPEAREPEVKPEILPEAPYERPRSRQLHVMNDDIVEPEDEADTEMPAALGDGSAGVRPITESQGNVGAGSIDAGMQEVAPSPISEQQEIESADSGSRFLPSYYQSDATRLSVMPLPNVEEDAAPAATTSQPESPSMPSNEKRQSGRKVPLGFREILAIKDGPERIKTYKDTRQIFADMDTGLQSWLNGMLVQHPEHANLNFGTAAGHQLPTATGTFGRHRHSPSIIKIAKQQFSHSDGTDRKASAASYLGRDSEGPPKTPSKDRGEGIDMDRVQQRGKDLMKSAGAGAKGLFAKGRNRFGTLKGHSGGGDKAPIPPPQAPSLSSASPIIPSSTYAIAPTPPPDDNNNSIPSSSLHSTPSLTAPAALLAARHSRASSASPALHLSRTGTPSSAASRPLAQAFERLRERSRSKSTGHSRSKSRPASLVITNPDVFRQSQNASPLVAGSQRRVEAWDEPDAVMPSPVIATGEAASDGDGIGTPARLGVLPSPTADDFGGPAKAFSGLEVAGFAGDALAEKKTLSQLDGRGGFAAEAVRDVPKDRDSVPEERQEDAIYTRPSQLPRLIQAAHRAENAGTLVVSEDHDDDSQQESSSQTSVVNEFGQPTPFISSIEQGNTSHRPQHERKISALASLPSQQRTRGLSSPTSPVTARLVSDDDDLHSKTPTASNTRSPKSENVADDEGDLYNTTPVAIRAVAPWQKQDSADVVISQQPLAASPIEQQAMPRLEKPLPPLPSFGEAKALDSAAPIAQDEADGRSEVSAEEPFENASEHRRSEHVGPVDSRHSSVSSLGGAADTAVDTAANTVALQPNIPPFLTAQAVPAGPIGPITGPVDEQTGTTEAMISAATQSPISAAEQHPDGPSIMSPSFNGTTANSAEARPSQPLSRAVNGIPVPESLDSNEVVPVDLTGLAGPPSSTVPLQQHPLHRDSVTKVQPSECEKPRSSQVGISAAPAVPPSQSGENASENKRPRRFSGIFRGSQRMPDVSATIPDSAPAPAPSAISDQYGLEDIHAIDGEHVSSGIPSQPGGQQEKRRSSIWEAFKRTPSTTSKAQVNGEDPIGNPGAQIHRPPSMRAQKTTSKATDMVPRANKKPQRAASAAAAPTESKQKRFSGLGKLFGRSSTQGRNSPKPNKLQKVGSTRQAFGPSGSISGFDKYDTKWGRQAGDGQYPGLNPNLVIPHPPADLDARGVPIPTPLYAPPQGWYSPDDASPSAGIRSKVAATMPQPPSVPHHYRRLHSEGFRRGLQQAQVPEAFRPIEASYGPQAVPIGHPETHQPPVAYPVSTNTELQRQPTLPTKQPYWGSPPPKERQYATGSSRYHLSPQLSNLSQYQHERQARGNPLPTISPVQSAASPQGLLSQQRDVIDSLDQDIARSPAREYADQQTPWSIDLPNGRENSRSNSQPVPARGQRSVPPSQSQARTPSVDYAPIRSPPPVNMRYSPHGIPMSPQSPEIPGPFPYHALTSPYSTAVPPWQDHDPQVEGRARADDHGYASPPCTPQSPVRYNPPSSSGLPTRQHAGYTNGPPPPHPRHVLASQQQGPPSHPQQRHAQAQQFYPSGQEERPLTYQRTLSGYSGRRDDAAVSEQDLLIMRGASYPGQEWAPTVYD